MIEIARVCATADLAECLAIRHAVFVEGQDVPEHEEVDGKDDECLHYLLRKEGKAVATARVLSLGEKAKIQRVAVLKEARTDGIGSQLMRFILEDLTSTGVFAKAVLGSQTHAIEFYERLGFVAFGPEYDDAGIPHRDMSKAL